MTFHPEKRLFIELSSFEESLVLSHFPKGTKIIESKFFNNYNLPCPIKVTIKLPNKKLKTVVLRKSRNGNVGKEAKILRILLKLRLPVPEVLNNKYDEASILSLLPGINLQVFSIKSKKNLKKTKKLLTEGIIQLNNLTSKIKKKEYYKSIPKFSLINQLKAVKRRKNLWNSEPIFIEAVKKLEQVLKNINTKLVFSNGDYQPANFLTDGNKITGFVDFDNSCFQDPLIGIVKFPIYDINPLNKEGFVDLFLKTLGFNKKDFYPRLALGCLITLQREIPIGECNEKDKKYRSRVLRLLKESLV